MARGRSRMETLPMHGIFLALTLTAYLMTPASFLARLWNLPSGYAEAPASVTLDKEGPGLDPSGATTPTTEAGPGLDPFGHS